MDGVVDGVVDGVADGGGASAAAGLCIVVDVGVVNEAAGRLARVRDALPDAAQDLDRLPVLGVALGADPLLDAVCDLARQWVGHLDAATAEAGHLAAALRTARTAYARAELAAETASRTLIGPSGGAAPGGTP